MLRAEIYSKAQIFLASKLLISTADFQKTPVSAMFSTFLNL
jgi:hypothetical protein